MNRLLLSIIAIVGLFAFVYFTERPLGIGSPLPNFNATNILNDQVFSTESIKGRPYLLIVWASWCPACQFEHPFLKQIATEHHIPIYGILLKDEPNDALAFLNDSGNPYAGVMLDPESKIARALRVSAIPTLFLIDKAGIIRYRHTGVLDNDLWSSTVWPLFQQYSQP